MSGLDQKGKKGHDFEKAKEKIIGSAIITTICFVMEYHEEIGDYITSTWEYITSTDTE